MKKFLTAVIFLLSLSSFACAENYGQLADNEPPRNLSTSVDAFCWKYFATLNLDENVFYSPYGINAALSILANGASGDTLKEIIFALEADNVDNLNECHQNFSESVAKKYHGDNLFMESNLLLIDKKIIGRGLNENFKRVVTDIYQSDVREADFENNLRGEQEKISQWVSDRTNGFIPNYNSIVNENTLTDLLNVVYFKGKWAMPFKASNTSTQDFKNRDGSVSRLDMMSKIFDEKITYRENDKYKGIELPYSENTAMYLIMPVDNSLNVAESWNNETPTYRASFLDGLKYSSAFRGEVVVRLPKFELDIENSLVASLKAMGIEKSFTGDAEFFNIVNDTSLKIDNAKHRAKIKVDEQGTEAAAITEITLNETCAPIDEPPRRIYFIADKPFLFVIKDIESNVTLFAGVVNKL